ncbi:uncharacterized protein LOC110027073 [Phalaenopsis equestris]|uniref:uncharacterized protein LOC110027073 n=1 Tax=Phalaenopsis equestris TaxID=78828 RepID=UPI0009E2CAF4|nr:uncharacterized protein LOC110027073 [Phalaenopsis equestris]
MNNSPSSAAMAAQICDQIRAVFAPPHPSSAAAAFSLLPPPLEVLAGEIARAANASKKVFVHGVGREGLMLKAFCMRLFHLGISSHVVGDVTTPPISSGDLLIASAGPGSFSTVDAICRVSKSAGARIVLITAQPGSGSEASLLADSVAYLPGRTMADDEVEEGSGASPEWWLPMGSVYEGAMFVLFEMVVVKLGEKFGRTAADLRSRHTNLE